MNYPTYPTGRMQYIDMDQRYRPEVVYFDGINGLGQLTWWESVFGKSGAWYDRLNSIQNALVVLTSEVSVFGDAVWNAVKKTAAVTAGAPPRFPDHATEIRALESAITSIIVTKTQIPSDAAVDAADVTAKTGRAFVEFAKKVAPEIASDVAAEGAKMEQAMSKLTLKSPGEVGRAEFLRDLEDRAKNLGLGLGIGALAIAGVVIAALVLSGPSKPWRNNPRRRRRRARRGAGMDLKKIALYGGLGYLAYTQILAPKSA